MESEAKFGWIGEASSSLISHNGNQKPEVVVAWIFAQSGGATVGVASRLVKVQATPFNVEKIILRHLTRVSHVTSDPAPNSFCHNKAVEVKTLAFYVTICPRALLRIPEPIQKLMQSGKKWFSATISEKTNFLQSIRLKCGSFPERWLSTCVCLLALNHQPNGFRYPSAPPNIG